MIITLYFIFTGIITASVEPESLQDLPDMMAQKGITDVSGCIVIISTGIMFQVFLGHTHRR